MRMFFEGALFAIMYNVFVVAVHSHGLVFFFLFWPFRVRRWIIMRLGIETCGFYFPVSMRGRGGEKAGVEDDAVLLWKHMGAFALIGIGWSLFFFFLCVCCSWLF